ncbi:uncharacterized protein LOC143167151 [Aptenodytes patagonicus]|uniref:uncharacterized protein LOC143167151 n=1 Tax=Aptenodytes patagonicus TaxID=9234 RepID=UPI003F9FC6FC
MAVGFKPVLFPPVPDKCRCEQLCLDVPCVRATRTGKFHGDTCLLGYTLGCNHNGKTMKEGYDNSHRGSNWLLQIPQRMDPVTAAMTEVFPKHCVDFNHDAH